MARAVEAAHQAFDDPRSKPPYEPRGLAEVEAAVSTLVERFQAGSGTLAEIIENARAAAKVLSEDPFQALSEVVQNADDVGATRVHFALVGDSLFVGHNGRPLTLRDVHALAAPWLTTKRDDAGALGRFGIGLMTLSALSDSFEMHSSDYHVRFGAPTLEVVAERAVPSDLASVGDTSLYLRLREADQATHLLMQWASRWDDTALLFLRSIRSVRFSAGDERLTLSLTWRDLGEEDGEFGGRALAIRRREAHSADGRSWVVHDAEFEAPGELQRAHKATLETTPVAVALSLSGEEQGMLYAGLPLTSVDLPLRVNAQFDPIASRQGVATNAWNLALIPLIANLWGHAIVQLFRERPALAWTSTPLGTENLQGSRVTAALQKALVSVARTYVADLVEVRVRDSWSWIGDLAYEDPELDGRLASEEVAQLAELDDALPASARDANGRWRLVLDDWRCNGNEIADSVSVLDALRLFEDPNLANERVLAVGCLALDNILDKELATAKCVVRADGSRCVPPNSRALDFLVPAKSGLSFALGLGAQVHECHLGDSRDARVVLEWLQERGSMLRMEDSAVLSRLAAAGQAGTQLKRRLDDDQLVALRDALEGLGQAEWASLAPAIGRAVLIEGYRFAQRGRQVTVDVHPSEAYLGRSVDRDPASFAVAAEKTVGLAWVAPRYATVLRSALGRQGLGALRFLRLLGAETSPRVSPHPGSERKYGTSSRLGVAAWRLDGPQDRYRAITALGGEYTLDDSISPDLQGVVEDIAADRKPARRRARAAALIATLGRAWNVLGDQAEVTVAAAYYTWNSRGSTRAWWLWTAATTPWLDDDSGRPRPPVELRLRTPATMALYGANRRGYVHHSLKDARVDVLNALGVAGEPNTAELCQRLVDLRDHADVAGKIDEVVVLYRAIADHLAPAAHASGDLTSSQLRKVFDDGPGLVYTNLGWRRPSQVLGGRPIFGDLAPFTPTISDTERLWRSLNVRRPEIQDCVAVITEIGQAGAPPDSAMQTILLETFRELGRLAGLASLPDSQRRRLARLPLWTTAGWVETRPVYAVHDPVLASGLANIVPVWRPGGEVSQFYSLFRLLRLVEVPASAGQINEGPVDADEDLTRLMRSAILLLHDDLVRNDPATASALRIPWSEFERFQVVVCEHISVHVPGVALPAGLTSVAVDAKASPQLKCVFVTDPDLLGRLEGGGRALAGLFETDHRRVAQAWLAAMERAAAEEEAEGLRMAEERAAEETLLNDERIQRQTLALQNQVKDRRKGTPTLQSRARPSTGASAEDPLATENTRPARKLIDPSAFEIVNPNGDIVGGDPQRRHAKRASQPPLREPTASGSGPQERSAQRGYTDLEKETIGYQLIRQVLGSNDEGMVDLRSQRGVGADAVDDLRQFYEFKVFSGGEPDEIRMTDSEIRRALDDSAFFLVIASGVEVGSAEPKVRVIAQPLAQLHKLDHRDMRLGGVRSAHSLLYRLAPMENG
ncbi:MAG TPA: hypothetical protein VFW71_16195 [Actinomycetota bacterium]|nr:hypothetical protein [Actinomycetota bacterium]